MFWGCGITVLQIIDRNDFFLNNYIWILHPINRGNNLQMNSLIVSCSSTLFKTVMTLPDFSDNRSCKPRVLLCNPLDCLCKQGKKKKKLKHNNIRASQIMYPAFIINVFIWKLLQWIRSRSSICELIVLSALT